MVEHPSEHVVPFSGPRWILSVVVAVVLWWVVFRWPVPPPVAPAQLAPPPAFSPTSLAPAVRDVLLWLLSLRLVGLLTLVPPLRRWFPAPRPLTPEPRPWSTLNWRIDGPMMVGLLLFTGLVRWKSGQVINPQSLPFGSDWFTYIENARAVALGAWQSYNGDKLIFYPWLVAQVAPLVGGDFSVACQRVSLMALTLSAPFLFITLRYHLGRAVAVGGGLLFAFSGMIQLQSQATTSYGLFAGQTLLLAGLGTLVVFTRRWWTFVALGLTLGMMILTEVKTLTVATPLLLYVGLSLLRRGIPWSTRVGGPLVVATLAWGISHFVLQVPVDFTSLDEKLDRQRLEIVRFMVVGMDHFVAPGDVVSLYPSLAVRLRFNLASTQALVREVWPGLVFLLILGLFAPLLARGYDRRDRWESGGAVLYLWGLLGSTAGAYSLLFLPHFIIHALPYILALMVAGAWVLSGMLAPAGSPHLIRWLMGWGIVLQLGLCSASLTGIGNLPERGLAGARILVQQSLPTQRLLWPGAARQTARWIETNLTPDTPFLWCDDSAVGSFLVKWVPPRPADVHPMEQCERMFQGPPTPGRVWVVDDRQPSQLAKRLKERGAQILTEVYPEGPRGPGLYVLRESS